MRNHFFLLFIFIPLLSFSQQTISGIVKDAKTNTSLPFATILTNTKKGTITDVEGKFSLIQQEKITQLTISYIGYETKTILLDSAKSFYTIKLKENVEKLNEVILVSGENPAIQIIKKTINAKKANDPEKVLKTFQFSSYNKLLVTANPDSINGALDSIYKIQKDGTKKFVKVDSSNFELKKQLDRAHLYITEKVSAYTFTQEKGKRETILATRMAGFKEPIYELLGVQLQSFSFYKNRYTIFGSSYNSPLSNNALNTYHYKILDTVSHQEREAYMIYYYPKKTQKTTGLEGLLYIDAKSYALQKAVAQLKAVIDVNATQEFTYYPKENIWFPKQKQITLKRGKNNNPIALFGSGVTFTDDDETQKDSTIIRTNTQDASERIYFISTEKNGDIQFNIPLKIKGSGLKMVFEDNAQKRDEAFWEKYRTDTISKRGKETYVVLDSIVEAEKVEKNIKLGRKLLSGYFPLKYVDIDLRNLIKYNNYEGFRLGIGLITNADFSSKYQLNGYGVYGLKDDAFKFGLGAAARLDKFTGTWFGAFYRDDLIETGSSPYITDSRTFSLFEPRLFNITLFHKSREINTYITHDITSKLHSKVQLTKSDVVPTYNYTFVNNGTNYFNFNTTTLTAALQWNPANEYMMAPQGKRRIKNGYPKFTLQLTKGIDNFLNGDFSFTKINFRTAYQLKPLNKATTTFLLEGGVAFGDLPITELYQTSPNNPLKSTLMRRFSIAGRNSFETMYFNEFFSDRYLTLQTKHYLKPFKIARKFNPQLVFISRFAIGNVENPENHLNINFKTLNHGYFESGFEMNKLFNGFGLSTLYRYGAYHRPNFVENISFKFTYYFSLGF